MQWGGGDSGTAYASAQVRQSALVSFYSPGGWGNPGDAPLPGYWGNPEAIITN
jgi:hypothetical protein